MPLKQHAAFLLFGLTATLGYTLGLAPGCGATAFAQEALPASPITEQREVTDPPAPQAIDLTIPQCDLWARMRAGFAMPNLDSPLVQDRQIWYAARPSAIKHMVERISISVKAKAISARASCKGQRQTIRTIFKIIERLGIGTGGIDMINAR